MVDDVQSMAEYDGSIRGWHRRVRKIIEWVGTEKERSTINSSQDSKRKPKERKRNKADTKQANS